MRFYGLAMIASAAVLGACGGGDKGKTDSTTTTTTGSSAAAAPAAGASASAAPTASTGTPAPITGTTHEVKMVGDDKGYRFEPANITIKSGDGIKYTMVTGGPHNVAFDNVPAAAHAQLSANMPNQMSDLSSPMLMNANESYVISFAKVPAGKYDYHCTPHLAMGMKGTVTVQ